MGRQVGLLDSFGTVVPFNELNSDLFVEREPLLRIGGVVWVVAIHRIELVWFNDQRLSVAL